MCPCATVSRESPLSFDESAGSIAPTAFGSYRVLHQIGSGVLGPVFRTYDPQHDRLVAVKAFRLDLVPEIVAQLADALRRLVTPTLRSPSIVPAIDAGLEGTIAYLATEYVTAETLDVALRHLAPSPLPRALPILSQIAAAIDAAALAGIGHGALHPRDVFVTLDTNEVRVTGFGVAPVLEAIGVKVPPRRPYAAPERVAGSAWDVRADVYALGAIAHELLTRRRPAGPGEQDGALTSDTPAGQRVLIRRVLSAALAEDPQRRFASARAFVEALHLIATGEATEGMVIPAAIDVTPSPAAIVVSEPVAQEASPVDLEMPADVPAGVGAGTSEAATVPADASAIQTSTDEWQMDAPPPEAVRPQMDAGLPPEALWLPTEEPDIEPVAPEPLPLVLHTPVVLRATPDQEPEMNETRPPFETFAQTEPARRAGFPWGSVAAVAIAGTALGLAVGYEWGHRGPDTATAAVAPAPARTADTDVAVPSEPAPTPRVPETRAEPRPAPPVARAVNATGSLTVRSVPSGALVVIDGRPHGQTPAVVRDLPLGAHTIEVGRPGYVPHTERLTLSQKDAARTVTVQLQPGSGDGSASATAAPARASTSSVYVDSRPRTARVLIDGRFAGTTPLRKADVPIGTHAVRLELSGYQTYQTTVAVKAGEPARITAALAAKEQH